jgi:hypothetical protein
MLWLSLLFVLVLNPPRRMVLVLVIERASSSTSTSTSTKKPRETWMGALRHLKIATSKVAPSCHRSIQSMGAETKKGLSEESPLSCFEPFYG